MALSKPDLTRLLDRWLLTYDEKPPGRIVVRDGGRWLTLVEAGGRWQWTTAKAHVHGPLSTEPLKPSWVRSSVADCSASGTSMSVWL